MREKLWKILHTNKPQPGSVKDILEIIYRNRSLTDTTLINSFLKPDLSTINYQIGDMDKVIDRLRNAITKKEKIIVYGDYDADGVTATAIMWEALHSLGANALPYIPHREREGYGMSTIGIDHLIENVKAQLIITVDQGISGRKQIAYAQEKGVQVIVTDHHTKPAQLPENCLIVHDHTVSGAAVAWKVATQLLRSYESNQDELPELSKKLLELVAIGVICDLIPLKGEARTLVSYGIDQLRKTTRPGLLAIAKIAGFEFPQLLTYHIGYIIGPRINATGRLEHAIDSLRLLCTNNEAKAKELAEKINLVNTDRKELTQSLIDEARKQAQFQKNELVLIVGHPDWNPGIIGLVASRLVEEHYKPTIAWGSSADHPELFKASARSVKGFNIIDAIAKSNEYLINYGGHPMAAGFSFSPAMLNSFTDQLRLTTASSITDEILTPSLDIDCTLPLTMASIDLYKEIQKLTPFGVQADEPLFASENLEVVDSRAIGADNKHLKLKVADSQTKNKPYEAIAFGMGEFSAKLRPGNPLDLAFHLDLNEWNGKQTMQLKVRDIKLK